MYVTNVSISSASPGLFLRGVVFHHACNALIAVASGRNLVFQETAVLTFVVLSAVRASGWFKKREKSQKGLAEARDGIRSPRGWPMPKII
jgi:hypothetical protein